MLPWQRKEIFANSIVFVMILALCYYALCSYCSCCWNACVIYWIRVTSQAWKIWVKRSTKIKSDRSRKIDRLRIRNSVMIRYRQWPCMDRHKISKWKCKTLHKWCGARNSTISGLHWLLLAVNHVRLQPAPFVGHRATTWSANYRARDASVASVLLIGLVPVLDNNNNKN